MPEELSVNTRSIIFHDDNSVEIIYVEKRDDQNGVRKTSMLQFNNDVDLNRILSFMQDCQEFIDDMLVVQRDGPA